jgi:aerobic carbon-monoxide dehydrogenase medium subunit
MVMVPSRYHRPDKLSEAVRLFADADEAAYLSGGHTLLPVMKQRLARPSDLIDLSSLSELKGMSAEEGTLSIGAMTLHAEVAESPIVRAQIPALAGLAGSIGDRQVRHRGTIGGSVANNDPAADYPSAVLGLGANVFTDRRMIPADDFFSALYETALEPGEIITRIVFPIPQSAGYAKMKSAASRYSLVGVFVARFGGDVRIAITGAGQSGVFRPREWEEALQDDFRFDALTGKSLDERNLLNDHNATSEYRAHLALVLARRVLENMGCAQAFM